ncbi:hypothetical protein AAFF_G00279110 [Aldrovandia affinis]|uniref:Uncharacterized protein n=1 Tax=Aldrovandia affinis TaxID=143900 RepID=A0AAD7WS80_9TELE|nr:hypothetical protein AAFF_G00279110 [Aldrovandia affinis]
MGLQPWPVCSGMHCSRLTSEFPEEEPDLLWRCAARLFYGECPPPARGGDTSRRALQRRLAPRGPALTLLSPKPKFVFI